MKPDLVILQETKMKFWMKGLLGVCGKEDIGVGKALPSVGRSGGIVVIWDNKAIQLSESLIGQFLVSIKIERGDSSWWLYGYGPNSYRERALFRDERVGLNCICELNWCVGGDFNVTRFNHEKFPGGRLTRRRRCLTNS